MKIIFLLALVFGLVYSSRVYLELSANLEIPHGWQRHSKQATGETPVSFVIALKQSNIDKLKEKFWSVSDPDSADYTNYLSLEELAALISPPAESVQKVISWLKEHDITTFDMAKTKDLIAVYTTVEKANRLLQVNLERFEHAQTGKTCLRALSHYSAPRDVADTIDIISSINGFHMNRITPIPSNLKRNTLQGGNITPSVVRQFLNIGSSHSSGTASKNLQATASFLQEYFSTDDLAQFQQEHNLPNQPVVKIIGPNDESNPGYEASLDIEYIMGIAPGVPTYFISTGGLHEGQEPFLQWATALGTMSNIPWVHSVSYGDYENTVTVDFVDRVDIEFMKLAARGVTIMFASGDSGVGCNRACSRQVPNWPASSAVVTSVGGVYASGNEMIGDQIASGGFSNYFGMPNYQVQAVKYYLSNPHNQLPPSTSYNSSGRAMPDVAAFSENVIITIGGGDTEVGGTSCAAPMFSAVVSLLNDALFNAGKKSLGFLNPLLYKLYATNNDVFTDITQGNNDNGCCSGFNAAPGWDPITGLGVPNFENLRTAVLAAQGVVESELSNDN